MRTVSSIEAGTDFAHLLTTIATEPVQIVDGDGIQVAALISTNSFEILRSELPFLLARKKLFDRDPHTVEALRDYSNSEISARGAMARLGLDWQGHLLSLMGYTSLPLPTLPNHITDRMVAEVIAAIGPHEGIY